MKYLRALLRFFCPQYKCSECRDTGWIPLVWVIPPTGGAHPCGYCDAWAKRIADQESASRE